MGKPVKCSICNNTDVSTMTRGIKKDGTPVLNYVRCPCGNNQVRHKNLDTKLFTIVLDVKDAKIDIKDAMSRLADICGPSIILDTSREDKTSAKDFNFGWRKVTLSMRYRVRGGHPAEMRGKIPVWIKLLGYTEKQIAYHNTAERTVI